MDVTTLHLLGKADRRTARLLKRLSRDHGFTCIDVMETSINADTPSDALAALWSTYDRAKIVNPTGDALAITAPANATEAP